MIKIFFLVVFLLGLVYLTLPGPSKIENFKALPNSRESRAWWDNDYSNSRSFFTNQYRTSVTGFYLEDFKQKNILATLIPPMKLNHPPEDAKIFIQNEQRSTYLEEYFYPFRESFFVNGFEPYDVTGKPVIREMKLVILDGIKYNSLVNIRLYHSSIFWRVLVYLGIWLSLILLFKVFKKALRIYK